MSTYIGQLQIGSTGEQMPIGSTLFGNCASTAAATTKQATLNAFDAFSRGVTVHIRFDNGNTAVGTTANPILLSVGGTTAIEVVGNFVCEPNTVVEFTYDEVDATHKYWRVNGIAAPSAATALPSNIGTANTGSSTKYAREDHTHSISVAEGDAYGQVKIAGQNVNVHGLGDAAYTDADAYATAAQGTLAENAMPKSGGTFTGEVIVPAITNSSDNNAAATKSYVDDAIGDILGSANAMVFKGTIGTGGNPGTLPNEYQAGWTYRIITADTYAGQVCEVGDLIIAIHDSAAGQSSVVPADWTVAQGNLDGVVTGVPADNALNGKIAVFDGTSGDKIKAGPYTLGKSVPSEAVFTDTTYTITDGQAYTAHTLTDAEGATILASVYQGVLTLAPGIQFTTGNVGASLTPTTNGAST